MGIQGYSCQKSPSDISIFRQQHLSEVKDGPFGQILIISCESKRNNLYKASVLLPKSWRSSFLNAHLNQLELCSQRSCKCPFSILNKFSHRQLCLIFPKYLFSLTLVLVKQVLKLVSCDQDSKKMSVCIVGAGLSGLCMAIKLKKAGINFRWSPLFSLNHLKQRNCQNSSWVI